LQDDDLISYTPRGGVAGTSGDIAVVCIIEVQVEAFHLKMVIVFSDEPLRSRAASLMQDLKLCFARHEALL
jgi:hypothetical protein